MKGIAFTGVNIDTAPVTLREKVAFSQGQIGDALQTLYQNGCQGIILSTCNRTEIYSELNGFNSSREAFNLLTRHSGMPGEELLPYLQSYEEEEAVRHLFRVASGLESMIVGEYEVLGQVKQALEHAEANGLKGILFRELFQRAVGTGRRVRDETDISKNAASVSSAAVALAKNHLDSIEQCKVLVVGAGEAGALVAKALSRIGVCQVAVTNRSFSKAESVADEIGGTAIPFHQFIETLSQADILISCSGAPHYVIEPDIVRQSLETRTNRPIMFIDIAMPRDIDPEVRNIDGAILYDIDDLNVVVKSNRNLREQEVVKAEIIVEDEVEKFMNWRLVRKQAPVIKALVDKSERIRSAQLSRTLEEIPGLSAEERLKIEAMTRSIVKKVLHSPISCIKRNNGEHIETVKELFELNI